MNTPAVMPRPANLPQLPPSSGAKTQTSILPSALTYGGAIYMGDEAERQTNPDRIFVYSVGGWGKTSLFTQPMPELFENVTYPNGKPLFLTADTEEGIQTLIRNKQVPPTPYLDPFRTLPELEAQLTWLLSPAYLELSRTNENFQFSYAVIDTINAVEKLLVEQVIKDDFRGERGGDDGFLAWGKGWEACVPRMVRTLNLLDRLRKERGIGIVLLAHMRSYNYKNPTGPDYTRFMADMNEKLFSLVHGWADMTLFGDYSTRVVSKPNSDESKRLLGRGKAVEGTVRVLHTTKTPAYDAKHRHGLPDAIQVGENCIEAAQSLNYFVKVGRETGAARLSQEEKFDPSAELPPDQAVDVNANPKPAGLPPAV